MNIKKYVTLSMLLVVMLGFLAFQLPKTVFAEPANSIYVVPNMVNATLMGLGIGDTFDVYIHVNFTTPALYGFEYKFFWNNTLINLIGYDGDHPGYPLVSLPWSPNFIAKNDTSVPGRYWLGASALAGATPFSGETWVTRLTFQIAYKPSYPEPDMSCALDLVDTKMSDESATPIPHTAYDGEYYIRTGYPEAPDILVTPALVDMTGGDIGDTFMVNIEIAGLQPAWDLFGWEAKLYYNTAMLDVLGATEGGFLPSFEGVNGTFFLISKHESAGYAHTAGLFLGTHTVPYGSGVLATIEFNVTYKPDYPEMPECELNVIDVKLASSELASISYSIIQQGYYKGPYVKGGRILDLFTEDERWPGYVTDVIGLGADQRADAFAPQENATLCVELTYGGAPIALKNVAFEVHSPHDDIVFTRQAKTNLEGIACISFRIPWPDINPEAIVFGDWYVYADADVAEMKVYDTLNFTVGWIVSVTESITETPVCRGDTVDVDFNITNISHVTRSVFITITIYDDLGVPVAFMGELVTVDPGTHSYSYTLTIPTWAYVGEGTVYINLYTGASPSNCGVCYSPEHPQTFAILYCP